MRYSKFLALTACLFSAAATAETIELLNVSYDPTREFYEEYNALFAKHWKQKTGQEIKIEQSHGGSGKQARSVIDGLKADVVTLALAYDIDMIAEKSKLLPADWQSKFPHNSAPYTSTIVFLVRKGNPKQIRDWDDLVKPKVQVVTPNPKTSGGARWNYLAAWGYAKSLSGDDEKKIKDFMNKLFKNVPVIDTGARGSTTTFVQRMIGDVLISWENEAILVSEKLFPGQFEIVRPSVSIRAEPPVAVVEKNAEKNKTLSAAQEYLQYLYSAEAQEIVAKHYYRPSDATVAAKYAEKFPQMRMLSIGDFGGWQQVQKKHFNDGGAFDQIYSR